MENNEEIPTIVTGNLIVKSNNGSYKLVRYNMPRMCDYRANHNAIMTYRFGESGDVIATCEEIPLV